MSNWARVVNTTTSKFMRDEETNVLRERKLLALLQSRGRVTFNHGGKDMDWKVRYRRAPAQGYADGDTLQFSRQNRRKTATLEWRGYTAQDSISAMEEAQNKGDEAIIRFAMNMGSELIEDITENFCDELYVDGNASGNTKRIHGLESCLSNSGAYSGGYIGTPSDSYAGLDCTLGTYGGSWSGTTWPTGTGDYHYDFWSPLIVDYTDTLWTASTKTWPNTCREALRFGIIKSRRNKSKKGALDLILLDNELFRQFEDKVESNERIVVQRGGKGGLVDLGFNDTITYDGVEMTFEYGVPASTGYGLSIGTMELLSLNDRLFKVMGPDEDLASLSKRFAIVFFGNLKLNPRGLIKFINVT